MARGLPTTLEVLIHSACATVPWTDRHLLKTATWQHAEPMTWRVREPDRSPAQTLRVGSGRPKGPEHMTDCGEEVVLGLGREGGAGLSPATSQVCTCCGAGGV